MTIFWCGFFIGIVFAVIVAGVSKYKSWDKWTTDDMVLHQEAEMKEFLLYKSEKEKSD